MKQRPAVGGGPFHEDSGFLIAQADHAVLIGLAVRQFQSPQPAGRIKKPVAFAGDHGMHQHPQRVEQVVPETAVPRPDSAFHGDPAHAAPGRTIRRR